MLKKYLWLKLIGSRSSAAAQTRSFNLVFHTHCNFYWNLFWRERKKRLFGFKFSSVPERFDRPDTFYFLLQFSGQPKKVKRPFSLSGSQCLAEAAALVGPLTDWLSSWLPKKHMTSRAEESLLLVLFHLPRPSPTSWGGRSSKPRFDLF